jgi:hypothetical protein
VNKYSVVYLYPQEVNEHQTALRKHLAPAFDHADRELTVDDALGLAQEGVFVFWVVLDEMREHHASVVTEAIYFPQRGIVRVIAVGGAKISEWLDTLIFTMEEYASAIGADAIDACVRPGLTRLLSKRGFYTPYTIMRKSVNESLQRNLH